ncbi:MAG: hypothetical protein K9K67_10905 [Bacteriovoracaceae bacterium]|nr:hypothetical protein [Bacteriovoracaceae bacterium]
MSSDERLKALAGVYKQNDGNTFVILVQGNSLHIKTNEIHGEKIQARGDGLYDVENTQAKIKFHMGANGIAHSLTFYLSDRQTVATRDMPLLKEKTIGEKFKELGVAILVFLALISIFFLSYSPMKNACLNGGSPIVCRTAAITARVMGRVEDSKTLTAQESRQSYNQASEEIKESCQRGDAVACLDQAKTFVRINDLAQAEKLLEDGCYKSKHGPSCQFWRDLYVDKGDSVKAEKIMLQSCEFKVAIGCYEYAWKLKKSDEIGKALTYFDKACEFGEEKSCYELALHHLKYDREKSLNYLISSCRSYHRQACDLKEKVEKYFVHQKKCKEESDGQSCFLMASFEQDYGQKDQAMEQYKKSCDMGYRLACNIVEREKKIKEMKEKGTRIETI